MQAYVIRQLKKRKEYHAIPPEVISYEPVESKDGIYRLTVEIKKRKEFVPGKYADTINGLFARYPYLPEQLGLKRGDIIYNRAAGNFRNDGVTIWNGRRAVDLSTELDEYGAVPPEFKVLDEFPFGYFFPAIVHNTYQSADLRKPSREKQIRAHLEEYPSGLRLSWFEEKGQRYGVVFDVPIDTFLDFGVYMSYNSEIISEEFPPEFFDERGITMIFTMITR